MAKISENDKGKKSNKSVDIVVVEDDLFLSEMLVTKFTSKGYKIVPAYNGKEGLELVEKSPPRVILLDIVMPVLNGYQFLEEVKKKEECSDIPILVLSNLGQPEEIAKAMELGALHFLVKANFTPEDIYKKVVAVIEQ